MTAWARDRIDPLPQAQANADASAPADTLGLLWLLMLALLSLIEERPDVILGTLVLGAATVMLVRWSRSGLAVAFVHDLFPVLLVLGSYLMVGMLIDPARAARWDALLAAIDARAFGAIARLWIGLFDRPDWLVDLAALGYFAFYPLPLAMAIGLRTAGRREAFDGFILCLVTTFLLSFVGYLLFPALGPRSAAELAPGINGGGAITTALETFLATVERTRHDAFPSGHTAIALVCMFWSTRVASRAWASIIVATSSLMVFATVYLQLHYVVDVAGGAALAIFVMIVTPELSRLLRALPALQTASPRTVAPLLARSDGELVRGETPARRIMSYLMRGRNESMVVHQATYDVTRTLAWLQRQKRDEHSPSMFDLLVCAIARTLHMRPGLNRFISGGNLYQRRGVFVSFAVKKSFDDGAPFIPVKIEIAAAEDFSTTVARIDTLVAEARSRGGGTVDGELRLATALPGPLLRVVMGAVRTLDRLNLMPQKLMASDPMYTSVFAANLGSIGLSSTSHHLYEYGSASIFAAMGHVEKVPFLGPGGHTVHRDGLEVRWSLDERVQDGAYCAASLAILKRIMEDPAAAFGPAE
ncbi:MAG TPA: phosphatase PAP2 family protein [Polyangia bacterium]